MNPPVRRTRKAPIEVSWSTPEGSAASVLESGQIVGHLGLRSRSPEPTPLTIGELTDLVTGLGFPAAIVFANDETSGESISITLSRPATQEEKLAAQEFLTQVDEKSAADLNASLEELYQRSPNAFQEFAAAKSHAQNPA